MAAHDAVESVPTIAWNRCPSSVECARQTGLSRKLVRQILRGEREDVFRIRQSSLTPWLPRLERDWAGGCRNGAEL